MEEVNENGVITQMHRASSFAHTGEYLRGQQLTPWLGTPRSAIRTANRSRTGATILLVEDDAAIAFMLTDVLESTGYQVREAATGAAARTLVEQLRPDLIILDLVLPDEDGLVLCSVLKNMANVPILDL